MSNRTLIIILVAIAAGLTGWWFWRRRAVATAGAMNGAMPTQALQLQPIQPAPGSQTYGGSPSGGFANGYGQVVGNVVQAACAAKGGGQLCEVAGSVATKVGTLYATGVQKVATTAYGGAKTAVTSTVSGAKKLLGKLF
jgi:hypothetical protein